MQRITLSLALSLALSLSAAVLAMPAAAEFQVFTDQNSNRHVSNISPAGLTRSGNLKPAYNPNSVVHQYPLMLERLRLQREELAREAMVARAAQAKKPSVTASLSRWHESAKVKTPVQKKGCWGCRD
jgi:hypothetical protein